LHALQVAVKLLTVDTEESAVLGAFLKEVALCACLRGCNRIVRLLGACLGGVGSSSSGAGKPAAAAAAASSGAAAGRLSAVGEADGGAATGQVFEDAGSSSSSRCGEPGNSPAAAGAAASTQQQHGEQQQQQQQQLALIMELVEGGNLAQRIYHPSKRRLSYLEVIVKRKVVV
jgi:hypothetical protein